MTRYAAHDAYFLVLIALRQIQSITTRQDSVSEVFVDNGDLQIWFDNLQIKMRKSLDEQINKFMADEECQN